MTKDKTINPNAPSENLLEEAIDLAYTNSQLFETYCDTKLAQLTEQQQLLLIDKGPTLVYKNGTVVNLTLCHACTDKIPLIESYRYLLHSLLSNIDQTTPLSLIQIAALFMQAMIVGKKSFYNIVSHLKLNDASLTTLKNQLDMINANKRLIIIQNEKNGYITNPQRTDLILHIKAKYKHMSSLFADLKLENQYHRANLKSIILLDCYQKSQLKFYFNNNFITTQFNAFSNDDQKQFMKTLIVYVDNSDNPINELLILLVDNKAIAIDALFDLITLQIQTIPVKPSYYYHRWDERRIAQAKESFESNDSFDKQRKIQWIQALAADKPRCLPVTLFRSHRVEGNPIILYCQKWVEILGIQIRPDVYDPLEEAEASTPTHTR